jgi:hypothetical protein
MPSKKDNKKKKNKEQKRLEFKKRCKRISKVFSDHWMKTVGRFMFKIPNVKAQKEEWTDEMKEQLEKLQKRDINDALTRKRAEKRRKDKEYVVLLEKEKERLKTVDDGIIAFNNLKESDIEHTFTIPEFFENEVSREKCKILTDLYTDLLDSKMKDVDTFFEKMKSYQDSDFDNLAPKIHRLANTKYFFEKANMTPEEKPKKAKMQKLNNKHGNNNLLPKEKRSKKKKSSRVESEEQKKIRKGMGKSFEKLVLQILLDHDVLRSSFKTDEEISEINERATKNYEIKPFPRTPDFLFDKVIKINGFPVKWIDCKNCTVINGLTDEGEVESFSGQIKDYCRFFGSGLVLFHRPYMATTKDLYDYPTMVHHRRLPR